MNTLKLFTEGKIGPIKLKNRSIRSAAFEGMSQNHQVTEDLIDYHTQVAKGGIGMTTVAYAGINKSALSFNHQLLLTEESIPDLKKLTDNIHYEGALASIQIGHCGNMANKSLFGLQPLSPSGLINIYGPTFPKKMSLNDIENTIEDFKKAVKIVHRAGFDAVEVHAGHGYLISQFLSPYTNKRKDMYGGSFENRTRFLKEVLTAVKSSLPSNMALIVKMNSYDGFKGGITKEEAIETAKIIEGCGAHAIIVSGGFVSKAPMYVMRGGIPIKAMAHYIKEPIKSFFVKIVGKFLIPSLKFKEGFFLDDAQKIMKAVSIPVISVGGMNSINTIESTLNKGFQFVAIARALIKNPAFINDLKSENIKKSTCTICNYCVAKMYSDKMTCIFNDKEAPQNIKSSIKHLSIE